MDATLLHSVAREAYEETGLVVTKIIASLGFVEFLGREGRAWRKYNLVCEVETVEGVKTDPVEHDAWGWFGEGEVVGLEVTSKEQRGCIDAAFEAKRSGWGGVEGEVEGGAE